MTAIGGYVAPTTESGALGVQSLDQFVLSVLDMNVADVVTHGIEKLRE